MDKDVYIKIKSTQCIEGDEIPGAELTIRGEYHYEENKKYFIYEESEDSDLGRTITRFDLSPEEIILERRGEVRTKMIFRLYEETSFRYEMPYGMLSMTLTAQELEQDLDEHGGRIKIIYDLCMDEKRTMMSRNQFDIEITDNISR